MVQERELAVEVGLEPEHHLIGPQEQRRVPGVELRALVAEAGA